jgi:hypothetical protein
MLKSNYEGKLISKKEYDEAHAAITNRWLARSYWSEDMEDL